MPEKEFDVKPLGQEPDEGASPSEENPKEVGASESELDDEGVEPDDLDDDSADEVDHEAELERERVRLGGKVDKERGKRIAAEKAKGLSREEVTEIVRSENAHTEKRLQRSHAEELADRIARSDAERDHILHHYDHSIIPSGSLEEDIENAHALANKKRHSSQLSELRAAARSKGTRVSSSTAGAPAKDKKPVRYTQDVIDGAKFASKPGHPVTKEEFAKKLEEKQT